MLYFSGFTQNLGNVDDGNTVMDYMDQERERGITITSAAITFIWKQFQMNLIDTPGHVDFTIEVERALRVLDGAVAIFDASAGVEAQSLTVWRQATRYNIPRIAYINKMDKSGADFYYSVKSIEKHLNTIPVPLQLPIGKEKSFIGVVDLISMSKLTWNNEKSFADNGKSFNITKLTENDENYEKAFKYRISLIEKLAQADEKFEEILLEKYDLKYDQVDDNILLETYIRKLSLNLKVTPILCGSSFKNIAVQPLLDAIVKYLPSPDERKYPFQKYYGDNFCALVFKSLHDHRKLNKKQVTQSALETGDDILTFIRIYNGELTTKSRIFNPTKNVKEECEKIFIPYANQMKAVGSVKSGNIAVVSGLKQVSQPKDYDYELISVSDQYFF
jgi:elongation factor G